jgi:hypothetical protein
VIDFVLLAARAGFFEDLILPGVALIFVLALIANSLLQKWGYSLW